MLLLATLALPALAGDDRACIKPDQVLPTTQQKEVDGALTGILAAAAGVQGKYASAVTNQIQSLSPSTFEFAWLDYSMCMKWAHGAIDQTDYNGFLCQRGLLTGRKCVEAGVAEGGPPSDAVPAEDE